MNISNSTFLEDFTIFIPVRNRQYNIWKILEYYQDFNSRKIIVDSSNKPYDELNDQY